MPTYSDYLKLDRLLALVDLVVWVLDPQKYADRVVHRQYLAQFQRHRDITVVLLNKADLLSEADLRRCVTDLKRLLDGKKRFLENRRRAGRNEPITEWPLTRDVIIADTDPGTHRIVFFPASPFFRRVELEVDLGAGHHHVPLLVSSYACASYRGS